MRAVRDSFLTMLQDNLTGLTVHNVRFEQDNRAANELQIGAVNVTFTDSSKDPLTYSQGVVLDILADDELVAVDMAQQVANLLTSVAYIPKLDYSTVPPVATGKCISWDSVVSFVAVNAESYFQLSAMLTLNHAS